MKCCCLRLWFNHPAPSWLNLPLAVREETGESAGAPLREGSRPLPRPEAAGRRQPVSGVGLVLFGFGCFWVGEGVRADTRLVRFVLLL